VRTKSDERGAVAVEFALIVPLLCMLLVGTVTVALAYSQKVALSNAVREGARLGASAPNGSGWLASVQQQTSDSFGDADGLAASTVCATLIKTTGGVSPTYTTIIAAPVGCTNPPANPTSVSAGCFVKVWASKQTHLNWVLGGADPFTKASAVAIYDRDETC
jgi:Flp pilus assembly protein TadG